MTAAQYAALRDQILALDEAERAQLRDELDASLADVNPDRELSPAWQAEIGRRIEQIDSGQVAAVPAADVHRRAKALLRVP